MLRAGSGKTRCRPLYENLSAVSVIAAAVLPFPEPVVQEYADDDARSHAARGHRAGKQAADRSHKSGRYMRRASHQSVQYGADGAHHTEEGSGQAREHGSDDRSGHVQRNRGAKDADQGAGKNRQPSGPPPEEKEAVIICLANCTTTCYHWCRRCTR